MQVLKASIDRLTLLGDMVDDRLMGRLAHNPFVASQKIAQYPYRYQWHMHDGSILQQAEKNTDIPELRYEFNPNNWQTRSKPDSTIMSIFKLFTRPRISRIDIALDVTGIDFSQCTVTDTKSRKEAQYRGRDKAIETYYIGTRRSPVYTRIYNKAREQGKEHYKDTDWWRIEAQINGDLCQAIDTLDPFEGIYITQSHNPTEYDFATQAALHFLKAQPEAIHLIKNRATKAKYKELLLATAQHIHLQPSQIWEQEKTEVLADLRSWLQLADNGNLYEPAKIQ